MLARKVVAGKEQIKKINTQLRESQGVEPQKSEDSFKSATDGEETISSETDQEPLEDLLKKMSDSYKPKRKRSSGVRAPGTARENKKRKVVSSIPVKTPPTRGRATRSQKKKSEDEDEVEEMEVVTPKAKKIKTSTMKYVSKTKFARPSSLFKRTRSALKSKKVKIVEEEEWSGEGEE
nr:uncharacterized protein LOC104118665 [Nicotiana tomentosiformis]